MNRIIESDYRGLPTVVSGDSRIDEAADAADARAAADALLEASDVCVKQVSD